MTVTLEFDLTNPEDDIKLSRALAADRMITAFIEIDKFLRDTGKYMELTVDQRKLLASVRQVFYSAIESNKIDIYEDGNS